MLSYPGEHKLYELDVASSAARIAGGIVLALRMLGVEAEVGGFRGVPREEHLCYLRPGSSDVVVGGFKVSGSAQRRAWGSLLQHGTLLIDFDPEEWLSVIRVSKIMGEELRRYVRGLSSILGYKPKLTMIIEAMIKGLAAALGYNDWYKGSLDSGEAELAYTLYKVKYSKSTWNLKGLEFQLSAGTSSEYLKR